MGMGNRVVLLAITRFANYGLMLVSPIVLVRLLTVQQFGSYREFLLYVGILQTTAGFGISESLLYFVAAYPSSPWRIVRHTVVLTFACSAFVVALLLTADLLSHGALVGSYRWPLAVCTLCATNLDFWECFWVAQRRPVAIFAYSAGRLFLRLSVVIAAAAITHDVRVIVWSFVALEGVRLVLAALAMRVLDRSACEPALVNPWPQMLRFCVPSGFAALIAMVSRNVSSVAVVKLIGSAALAQYSIGRFGEPIVITLRNSVSTVVLPEMVREDRRVRHGALALWRQAIVTNAIFLFPVVVLVGRFAHPLVVTVFGAAYAPAALVLQLYMLVVVRECFDFAPPLRAANHTTPMVASNIASALTCLAGVALLVPTEGVAGAMAAYVLACFVDATILAISTLRVYRTRIGSLLPWRRLGRVALAALIAGLALLGVRPGGVPEALADGLAGIAYLAAFAVLLFVLRVPEAQLLIGWLRRTVCGIAVKGA
jgi:O-antigen/teichoic acid export membrane protein